MAPLRHPSVERRPSGRRFLALLLSGLLPLVVPLGASGAQDRPTETISPRDPYAAQIAEASQRFGIPQTWIRAVMRVESRGDPRALSPKGAMGLMQIMPSTWADLRARHALGSDPYDERANILAGAAYLRELHDRYGSPGFLAAYNAGPARFEASRNGRPLPAETIAYVAAIAPMLDSTAPLGSLRLASVDLLAWTRAPLFATQPEHTSAPNPVTAEKGSGDIPPAAGVRDVSAIVPQAGGLFVTRSAGGEVR